MVVLKCEFCQEVLKTEELDTLKKVLPEAYSQVVCSFQSHGEDGSPAHFKAAIKMKLSTEEEVQKWLLDFQESSGSIWRKSKTFPNCGQGNSNNQYRVNLRCQHHTRWTGSYSKRTKNTSCPAVMYLVLKMPYRPLMNGRAPRRSNEHIKQGYIFHVTIRSEHNHGEALNYRPVSQATVQKLTDLFQSGHSASSALRVIKDQLRETFDEENYLRAAADRSVCPEPDFCYRLYYKLFEKACSGVEMNGDPGPEFENPCIPDTSSAEEVEAELKEVFEDVRKKLRDDQGSFRAPVKSFVDNFKRLRTDRAALISALTLFGKHGAVPQGAVPPRSHKAPRGRPRKNGVLQYPTGGRIKSALGGRGGRAAAARPSKAPKRDRPCETAETTTQVLCDDRWVTIACAPPHP